MRKHARLTETDFMVLGEFADAARTALAPASARAAQWFDDLLQEVAMLRCWSADDVEVAFVSPELQRWYWILQDMLHNTPTIDDEHDAADLAVLSTLCLLAPGAMNSAQGKAWRAARMSLPIDLSVALVRAKIEMGLPDATDPTQKKPRRARIQAAAAV